jgi:alpha-acetolactate decarboxylase
MVTVLKEKEKSLWQIVPSSGDSYNIIITEKFSKVTVRLVSNSHRQTLMLSVVNSRHGHKVYTKLEYKYCITAMFANFRI